MLQRQRQQQQSQAPPAVPGIGAGNTSGGGAGAASDAPRLQTEAVQKAGKRFKRRGSLIGSRNAGGLWEFLTSRLRLMARMRMEWGNIHEV